MMISGPALKRISPPPLKELNTKMKRRRGRSGRNRMPLREKPQRSTAKPRKKACKMRLTWFTLISAKTMNMGMLRISE